MFKYQKGFVHILLLIITIIVAFGAIGFLVYQNSRLKRQVTYNPGDTKLQNDVTPIPSPNPTTGWKTYKYEKMKLTFNYPPDWEIAQSVEGCYGPILGIKAKKDIPGMEPSLYPTVTFCEGGTGKIDDDVPPHLKIAERGVVDNHEYIKTNLKEPSNLDESSNSTYMIVIDTKGQNPNQPHNLILNISYWSEFYKEFGTEKSFDLNKFINTVDQILSTFKFTN